MNVEGGNRCLAGFKRKSYDKLVYAERLYIAFVDHQIGKLTPERLHIQSGMWAQYEAKALFYREAWCICALSAVARKFDLFPVLAELDGLVQAKRAARGIHYPHDQLMEASFASPDEYSMIHLNGGRTGRLLALDCKAHPGNDDHQVSCQRAKQQQVSHISGVVNVERVAWL
jgi:hypothetical protein